MSRKRTVVVGVTAALAAMTLSLAFVLIGRQSSSPKSAPELSSTQTGNVFREWLFDNVAPYITVTTVNCNPVEAKGKHVVVCSFTSTAEKGAEIPASNSMGLETPLASNVTLHSMPCYVEMTDGKITDGDSTSCATVIGWVFVSPHKPLM